jgi:tetratricopeptide (TPR) repeat protein
MVCPFCGQVTAKPIGACVSCGRALPGPSAPDEVAGLSRPPSVSHANDVLTLASPPLTPSPVPRVAGGERFAPGQVINGRYHVVGLVGRGGMGAVYHAWDEELGVGVAMKVILPATGEDRNAFEEMERRFKRELLLARQITHRNVVRIHDIGEVDGIKFITMPYVKGEDLATILKPGPLPIARALALSRQIVSGLAAAHDAGVIHRDLKPANIMVEEGEWALLMDFGIARSTSGTTHGATVAGTIVGTVDYMAPEQARGETVDGRADVYAFGLILYEMLAGRRQFMGDSAAGDLLARMTAPPDPVRALRPEVPDALEKVVTRCLQPDPAGRYQTCADLLTALDDLDAEGRPRRMPAKAGLPPKLVALAAAAIIAVAGVTYLATGLRPTTVQIERAPVSVLIADFENHTGDPVFDGTLAQSLSLAIEGAPFISSFPRTSARRVAEQLSPGATLNEAISRLISTREGIQVVLVGSVSRERDEYVLSVRAIDANGTELSVSRETAAGKPEVLPALTQLATAVRRSLGDVTPAADIRGETFTASSLDAARAYEEAQQLQHAGNAQGAIAAYERAVSLDPGLGRAYAGLAAVYANLGRQEEAERNYKLAMERIDRMTERERYRTRAGYYLFTRNTDGAIEQLTELLQRFPADTTAMSNLAFARFNRREFAAALDLGRKAAAVYSTAVTRTNVALYALYAGDFKAAGTAAAAALEANQKHAKAHLALALAHLGAGQNAEATAAYARLEPINPSLAAIGLADVALHEGRASEAAQILEQGAAADAASGNSSAAARKLIALAKARQLEGRRADAVRAVAQALAATDAFEVQVEGALAYIELGMPREAAVLADKLRASLRPDPQAYARAIDGFLLLARNQPREAVTAFQDGQKIADTWLGRFGLGRAYLGVPDAAPEAYAAFEACLRRSGEAVALFLDDVPTYHWLAPVHYYMGLAQQALGSPRAAESFKTFLTIKERGSDPLVEAAKQHIAVLSH